MPLDKYKGKRNFSATPEPPPKEAPKTGELRFVVQRHQASHLHYDLRLQMEGVLRSWAVPKGPSLNPKDKRLAMETEDHPYQYIDFHGVIPKGSYGAGVMEIFDEGTLYAPGIKSRKEAEKALIKGFYSGNLKFVLNGQKLKGEFALVKTKGEEDNKWLLIKHRDKFATDKKYDSEKELPGDFIIGPGGDKKKAMQLAEPATKGIAIPDGAKKAAMPGRLSPQLAKLTVSPFDDEDWLFEVKWDGYRALANIKDGQVDLYSRNRKPFKKYAPIVEELQRVPHDTILDGEIIFVTDEGYSDFNRLQNIKSGDKGRLRYYVFDIPYLDGHDLTGVPLIERKKVVEKLVKNLQLIKYSDHILQRGKDFFKIAQKRNLEGIIGKLKSSPYHTGKRSNDWVKIKVTKRQEAIVIGFTKPKGSRKYFGSLILGAHDEKGKLHYVGSSGGGFSQAKLKKLFEKMGPLVTQKKPVAETVEKGKEITWVEPRLICEVEFAEWTPDNRMRHPVFVAMREDKSPREVVIEKAAPAGEVKKEAEKKHDFQPSATAATINKINGKPVRISNRDKIFWPDEGFTKGDLIDYYGSVADLMVPYLVDRPQSLNRHPDGIYGESFYQKDMGGRKPAWAETVEVSSKSRGSIEYLLCQDKADLLNIANLGCIEINPWSSRVGSLDKPDYIVIDLDPGEATEFDQVVEVAQAVKEVLDQAKVKGYPKTSGSRGVHIYIPLGAKYSYKQGKMFANLIAARAHRLVPKISSIERSISKRKKQLYIDYLQNLRGQTLAAVYSVRPKPGATVSTPLEWREVKKGLHPSQFTIKTAPERFREKGDLFDGLLRGQTDIKEALDKLSV